MRSLLEINAARLRELHDAMHATSRTRDESGVSLALERSALASECDPGAALRAGSPGVAWLLPPRDSSGDSRVHGRSRWTSLSRGRCSCWLVYCSRPRHLSDPPARPAPGLTTTGASRRTVAEGFARFRLGALTFVLRSEMRRRCIAGRSSSRVAGWPGDPF